MQAGLLTSGLELALIGMGTVFVFLALLVLATAAMSRLVTRFAPEPVSSPPAVSAARASADEEVVAVIAAALERHRRERR